MKFRSLRAALLNRSYDDIIHNYKYTTFFYGTDYFGMPLDDTGPFLPGDWGFEAIPRDPNGTLPPSVESSDAGDDVPDLVDMPVLAAPSDAARSAAAATAAAALAALDVNEEAHPCRGCGKPAPPAGEDPFQRCPLCVDAKYALCARFCGQDCYKEHWEEHKAWHKQREAI